MRIGLVCVGKVRPPFADDVAHYERLLRPQARVETVEIHEGQPLLKRIPERAYVCALDREGEQMSSEQLAKWLEERRQGGRELWFVIGGARGFDPAEVQRSDHRLSLGPGTLPHQLARVVLLEQLFRAHKIINGEPYHY